MMGQFVTDTSTLAIFDPEALRHRIDDDCDWWTYLDDEVLSEINSGNVGIFELGSDGSYELRQDDDFEPQSSIQLRTPSGRIFLGAGEEISGGGLQPEAIRGGFFLAHDSRAALVLLRRTGRLIQYRLDPLHGSPSNAFGSWPSLKNESKSEQAAPSNGGQRPSLNSGFHPRRG
jgi:hypothetical protein